jgi:hypothetical protein
MVVFLFSAAAIPLLHVPGWWALASRVLPLAAGVAGLYRVLIAHHGLATWGMGGVVWLAITATAYLRGLHLRPRSAGGGEPRRVPLAPLDDHGLAEGAFVVNGASFLDFNDNISSLLMALLPFAAVASYAVAVFVAKGPR